MTSPDAFDSEEAGLGRWTDAYCWRCLARPPATEVGLCGACHYALVEEEYLAPVPAAPPAEQARLAIQACEAMARVLAPALVEMARRVSAAAAALAPLLALLGPPTHYPGPCPSCLSTLPKRGACRRCVARP